MALTEDVRSKYRSGPLLGKGAYGQVIGCTNLNTKQRFACKSVDVASLLANDGPNVVRRLRNEIGVMSYLAGHPNIVRLQDVYETEEHIFMVQELCSGGSLHTMLQARGSLGEEAAAGLFRSIIKSALHCHQVRGGARSGPRSHAGKPPLRKKGPLPSPRRGPVRKGGAGCEEKGPLPFPAPITSRFSRGRLPSLI